MKAARLELNGEIMHLVFNGIAMFEFEEKYGGASQLFDLVQKPGKKSFKALCEAIATLAEQGELVRRNMGYDHKKIINADMIYTIASPLDVMSMRTALFAAVTAGYGREITDGEPVDLGLVELSQKKTND